MAFHGNSKNMSHSFRLLNCGIEIARGEGFKVNRKGIDADFLLDVKSHKFEYKDIMKMLEDKYTEMKKAMEESSLPDDVDVNFVNDMLLKFRKEQLGL